MCQGIALFPKNKLREKKRIQTKKTLQITNPHQAVTLTGPDKLTGRFNSKLDKTKDIFFYNFLLCLQKLQTCLQSTKLKISIKNEN